MALITEMIGDIFSAPAGSVLMHACNAKGSWGSGVALAFKNQYPSAFKTYTNHCKNPPPSTTLLAHQRSLPGTTLLIPPQEDSRSPRHWIACLFTSHSYGRTVDSTPQILQNTGLALSDLARQLTTLPPPQPNPTPTPTPPNSTPTPTPNTPHPLPPLYAVRLNSGKFGVPWARTKSVLDNSSLAITVFRPEEDAKPGETPAAVRRKRKMEDGDGSSVGRKRGGRGEGGRGG